MRRIADVTRVVDCPQFLTELCLVRELELRRNGVVRPAEHFDSRALDVVTRGELGAGTSAEGDRCRASLCDNFESMRNDMLDRSRWGVGEV